MADAETEYPRCGGAGWSGTITFEDFEPPVGRYPAAGGVPTTGESQPRVYARDDESEFYNPPEERPEGRRTRAAMPGLAEPRTFGYEVEETAVYSPHRRVTIDGNPIGADREITVRASQTGASMADITFFNLDARTWTRIDDTSLIEVELGWRQAASPRVFRGRVITKRRRAIGADRQFTVRALGEHGTFVGERRAWTFNGLSPSRIIENILKDTPLERGYISTASTEIDGHYTISKRKPLERWFDELARIATEETGLGWVWYLEDGELYFHPTAEQVTEPIELEMGKSLLRATPVGSTQVEGRHAHELVMRCEPVISRGLTVVCPDKPGMMSRDPHRVRSYTFESNTTTGRHHTTATAVPLRDRNEIYNL